VGLSLGTNDEELLIGTSLSDPIKVYKSDLHITQLEAVELVMEGFSSTNPADFSVMNLVKNVEGVIYALLFEEYYEDQNFTINTHVAQVDLDNEKLIHTSQIGTGVNEKYTSLVLVPAYAL